MRMNAVIQKLTFAVGIRSVREEDDARSELHGGSPAELQGRRDAHARSLGTRFAALLGLVD